MRVVPCLLALASATSIARAQPVDQVTPDHKVSDDKLAVGLAVNPPLRWKDAGAIGVSGYIGFAKQHALRINVATYEHSSSAIGALVSLAAGEDGDEALHTGRTTDIGIGYQHYSRSMFEGCILELGVLRRAIDIRDEDDFASPSIVETKGTSYGGRAMIGWSWLWSERVFLATGVGVSIGRFAGSERIAGTTYMPEYTTKDVVRYETTAEAYLRIGLAFGL